MMKMFGHRHDAVRFGMMWSVKVSSFAPTSFLLLLATSSKNATSSNALCY